MFEYYGRYPNKHTESIAKAIQVPHRPQQIQIWNHFLVQYLIKNS